MVNGCSLTLYLQWLWQLSAAMPQHACSVLLSTLEVPWKLPYISPQHLCVCCHSSHDCHPCWWRKDHQADMHLHIENSFNKMVLFHAPLQDLWQYQTYGPSLPLFASIKCTYHILLKVLLTQDTFKLELDIGVICFILGIHSGDCFLQENVCS